MTISLQTTIDQAWDERAKAVKANTLIAATKERPKRLRRSGR